MAPAKASGCGGTSSDVSRVSTCVWVRRLVATIGRPERR